MLRHSQGKVHGEGKKKKGERYTAEVKKDTTKFHDLMKKIGSRKMAVTY